MERADKAALADPLSLAVHLDDRVVRRPHLEVISSTIAQLTPGGGDRVMIICPPQVGKPVHVGAMILMGDGSRKPLSQIRVGDYVITHKGRPRRVLAVHEQGLLPTLKITTYSGRSTIAAHEHPFLTPYGWVQARDLRVGDTLAAVPEPHYLPPNKLSADDARLLGYFIGDGSTSRSNATITTGSDEVEKELYRLAEACGFQCRTTRRPLEKARRVEFKGGVREWLVRYDVAGKTSHTKRVPAAVFTSPPEVIAEFIAGYFDCDGTVSYRGVARDGLPRQDVRCELYSVNRDLLLDVQHLLLRLGIRSLVRQKNAKYRGKEHISYRLQLIRSDDVARFREAISLVEPGRAQRLEECNARRSDFGTPFVPDAIVSIEELGDRECRCLTVQEDHTFTSDDLVVHNTWLACWSVLWWLIQHPDHRVIIGSYGTTLAADRGRTIRRLVENYGHKYGLELMKGAKSVTNWALLSGGGCRSAGVGAGITGMPADLFLIDDPVRSRADAESRLVREALWDWWSGDVNSRLAPGAPVVLVNTRWHPEDLSGQLIAEEGTVNEGGRWRIVYLPAFAVPANADRDIPPDSLGRSPGQPLTHPRIDINDRARLVAHWEDKRRSATARDWAALWQGDPRPVEGALVTRSLLRARHDYTPMATPIKQAIAVDPAAEGRDSVGIVAGWLGDDLRLYVSQDASMAGGVSVEKWTDRVVTLAYRIEADAIIYEQNYGKAMIRRVITAAWDDAQRRGDIPRDAMMPLLVPEKAKKGKYLRAEPVAQLLTVDKIRLAAPMPELESEWCSWVPTDPMSPGRIDAMVYLAYRLLRPRRSRGSGGRAGINPGAVSRSAVLAEPASSLTIPTPRGPDRFALRTMLPRQR